jgi:hypothetical protein
MGSIAMAKYAAPTKISTKFTAQLNENLALLRYILKAKDRGEKRVQENKIMSRFIQFGSTTPDSTCIRVNTTHDVVITATSDHIIISVNELSFEPEKETPQQTFIVRFDDKTAHTINSIDEATKISEFLEHYLEDCIQEKEESGPFWRDSARHDAYVLDLKSAIKRQKSLEDDSKALHND